MGHRANIKKSCRSKVKYRTEEAAYRSMSVGVNVLHRLQVYKCYYCSGFHIGHSSRGPRFRDMDMRLQETSPGFIGGKTKTAKKKTEMRKRIHRQLRQEHNDDDLEFLAIFDLFLKHSEVK